MNTDRLEYRADIDGLRAVAVLAVLFFHADLGCPGGYVGVDVFFVISGYLITGLILKELDRGQFQVLAFWERRVRRILPAVAVVMLACLVGGWFLLLPHSFKELGESASAQALLASNLYFWIKSGLESGYFHEVAGAKPLLHTWSLSVEEQFYLLFPFLLIALHRGSGKSRVRGIVLIGTVSFSLSVVCSYLHPSANFYLLPMRAWELLLGSLLAAIPARRAASRWLTESSSLAGLLAIGCAIGLYGPDTRFPGVAALVPCVGTSLILRANALASTCVGKVLAARPVVFVGLISYSLYLWHWPILVFVQYSRLDEPPLDVSQRVALLLASMVVALLSWRFVESPFRRRLVLKRRGQVFAFASITAAALGVAGLAVSPWRGAPRGIPSELLRQASGPDEGTFYYEVDLRGALAGEFYGFGVADESLPIDLLVWGDSHAMGLVPVLGVLSGEHAWRGVAATHAATTPLVGYADHNRYSLREDSIAFKDAIVRFVRTRHVRHVLLAARWDYYIEADQGTERLRRGILATIEALEGSGTRLWILRQVPKQRRNVREILACAAWRGVDPKTLGLPLAEHHRASRLQDPVFAGLGTEYPGVSVLDPTDLFLSPENRCRIVKDGKALYSDDDHLTVDGANVLRPLLERIFEDPASEARLRPNRVLGLMNPSCPSGPSGPRLAIIESSPEGGEAWNKKDQNLTCSPHIPQGEDSRLESCTRIQERPSIGMARWAAPK